MIIQEIIDTRIADDDYKYMLLSRMQSDCKWFLGGGNRIERYLWSGSVKEHIADMKALWNSFNTKPMWLTMEEIEEFERDMGATA